MAPKSKSRSKSPGKKQPPAAKKAEAPPPPGPPSISEATTLLKKLSPKALTELLQSEDAEEQLALQRMFAFLGQDTSWAHAQSLREGSKVCDWMMQLLEVSPEEQYNRRSAKRLGELAPQDPGALEGKSAAAHTLAVFLDACQRDIALPEPPEWPLTIPFTDLKKRLAEAASWGKTALVICDGHAKEADTYFTYAGYVTIDAKYVLGKVQIEKAVSLEDMREELRGKVITAMRSGLPLHLAMHNSAVAFKEQYCEESTFPQSLFDFGSWCDSDQPDGVQEYKKIVRPEDLLEWTGEAGVIKPGFHLAITSDFSREAAVEHLPAALPHIPEMAIIVIDSASFS
eukprot:TRINITY_DN59075_c0_g1_i1.p1 TRINITY_DN59075_c0_g1~~TRINITY_DN59075_c0_g1_i1.p1  ORF type:complete len:358 (-),score=66.63 TRINITY_DN59075_c0_g1_i1:253-1278(-)